MQVFRPGDHGSTFGGNPLGAAVGRAALAVLLDEELPQRSRELGAWYAERLGEIDSPHIDHIRGRGLMIGVVIKESSGAARPFCEALMERGILCNDTHHQTIRIAPPLVVTKEILEETLPVFEEVTSGVGVAV
jgi:ornithine--oxo-acid transaminase